MVKPMKRSITVILLVWVLAGLAAQQRPGKPVIQADSVLRDPGLDSTTAFQYLHKFIEREASWRDMSDPLRSDFTRLLDHTREPYDSIRIALDKIDLRTISVTRDLVVNMDSTAINWLNDSTFVIDSMGWKAGLYMRPEPRLSYPVDFSTLVLSDSLLDENGMLDQELFIPDTIYQMAIDTAAVETLGISMLRYMEGDIHLLAGPVLNTNRMSISKDSLYVVVADTLTRWMADRDSPFRYLEGKFQLDSLHYALKTLLDLNMRRDSTQIILNDLYGRRTPIWVTSGNDRSTRFWVKNLRNDSITLWVGNPSPKEISLLLEDDINVNRIEKVHVGHLPGNLAQPTAELEEMSSLVPHPIFWDYEFSSAFSFNQTYLSHWTKGGESSLTTMLDMMGGATYNNKNSNTQWINSARIKFGTLITGKNGLRKNNDLFEIDSKFNWNASGKIGMSASLYMKNQLAKGYNYPNDSVVVSKFMNPASLTIGLGAEYKPFKHTIINMAPLSYKTTWVLDTAGVDQTKHGIAEDKRAKQELGTQVVMINKFTPFEDLAVTNRLRLFSNYLNHPQNVDVDWEVLVDTKINWFFTVRLNLHLVYDDDVRFEVLDSEEQPVLLPDGKAKKVARTQFKEFVGLSMLFKF